MIINRVIIENFRCYYGKNEISFNTEGKTTLIYGLSGYGKSSLLQFFRWMFYDDVDFGLTNDKPLWNQEAFEEYKTGKPLSLSGQIDFEHLGVKYSLMRSQKMKGSYRDEKNTIESELGLWMLIDDNWTEYKGDVYNKINSILPKALSKYFLLDGENAREIVLNSKELRQAIHSLFGLDVYANALSHIGSENKKRSVLGRYATEMASKMTGVVGNTQMTIPQMQDSLQDLDYEIEELKAHRRAIIDEIEEKDKKKDEIFKVLGEVTNEKTLKQLIKTNQDLIQQTENAIKGKKHEIGNLFYRWYPYLILSETASMCSTVLREKNASLVSNTRDVFQTLKKPLLKEIMEKDMCVCGRPLDNESRKHIEDTINIMPPGSFTYEFGQFVSKVKEQIICAQTQTMDYEDIMDSITASEHKIIELENENEQTLEELKRLGKAKGLVDELQELKDDIKKLTTKKDGLTGKITNKKQFYEMYDKLLNAALKNAKVSDEYKEKIETFKAVKKILEIEKDSKEAEVKSTLNACVKDVFTKLTTQSDIDIDSIQFVDDNFALRSTFLTGGQQAIDEYSYVIGMVKALQECNADNSENPIIIDAPFAFTDNDQSEHIFKTLPSVSKQTILLTLDINKIRPLLVNSEDEFELYILRTNAKQSKTTIERGTKDDLEF